MNVITIVTNFIRQFYVLVELFSLELLTSFIAQLMLQKNRSVVRSNQIFKIYLLSFAIAREFRA